MVVQLDKKLLVAHYFGAPGVSIEGLQGVETVFWELQSGPLKVLIARHPANWGLFGEGPAAGAIDDPLEHAHILGKARPDEPAFVVLAEPVDVKDARSDA